MYTHNLNLNLNLANIPIYLSIFTLVYQQNKVLKMLSLVVDSTLMFASHGNQIGLVKLIEGYRLSTSTANGHYISTKSDGKKEIVLQV
jgi:hypothetical protein